MPIPETQLETWSNQGAQKRSADTYTSVKYALSQHSWPVGMNHDVYLQGSYPNATNIRGDSDVDVVVESSNVFYDDADENLRAQLGLTGGGSYVWTDFRDEVKKALTNHYGFGVVSQNNKCLKVKGDGSNRLDADVVPCITHRHYSGTTHVSTGVAFWTQANQKIVNYPKSHLSNGQQKNSNCSSRYKPSIRVFKNARNNTKAFGQYPSYFVECLLYNLPDSCFVQSFQTTFRVCVESLRGAADSASLENFTSQNGLQPMFGIGLHQSNIKDAEAFIGHLIDLWNDWGK